MASFALVVAKTSNGGIGFQGNLPWHPKSLKADMNWFKTITTNGFILDDDGEFHVNPAGRHQNSVIMGRKTWDSIPAKFKPLPQRTNLVLTRNTQNLNSEQCSVKFIDTIPESPSTDGILFIIGGSECYRIAIDTGRVQYIFCTQIIESPGNQFECDTFFPPLDAKFCAKTVDITGKVALALDPKISSTTYDSEEDCFVEAGVRYKMLLFVLKQNV